MVEPHRNLPMAGRPVCLSAAGDEPFGRAGLEAAQACCALVLSDIDSFREFWDDAAGYAAALDRLIAEPATRARRAAAAMRRGVDSASEAQIGRLSGLYAALLAGARAA